MSILQVDGEMDRPSGGEILSMPRGRFEEEVDLTWCYAIVTTKCIPSYADEKDLASLYIMCWLNALIGRSSAG
jgi:hypothetical protein